MPGDLLLYLEDIRDAIASIRSYAGGRTFEEFAGDPMCLDAVVLRFITIGEAVKQIPADITADPRRLSGESSPGSGISVSTLIIR
nr:HepT-like ribonuclease domain-containing protein [Methanoculleus sp.]